MDQSFRIPAAVALSTLLLIGSGCVQRTIFIDSDPPGALVWVNQREVGRTPATVDFLYYGNYDVRLEREGYEPIMTNARARAPLWDMVGPDFFAELLPFRLQSRIRWNFDLEPIDDAHEPLLNRADAMRRRLPPQEPPSGVSEMTEGMDTSSIDPTDAMN